MTLVVCIASATGGDEGLNDEVTEAVILAASGLVAALTLKKIELVIQNPHIAPYLDAIVDDLVDQADMTIREMTAKGQVS